MRAKQRLPDDFTGQMCHYLNGQALAGRPHRTPLLTNEDKSGMYN